MKSATLPSFWDNYKTLNEDIKRRARKTFLLWMQNPFHPLLHFKCINVSDNLWSVRISLGYRAIDIWEGDIVTWFWIGSHDDYEKNSGKALI